MGNVSGNHYLVNEEPNQTFVLDNELMVQHVLLENIFSKPGWWKENNNFNTKWNLMSYWSPTIEAGNRELKLKKGKKRNKNYFIILINNLLLFEKIVQ